MVLDDIADDAILVKVASPSFCAKVFAEDDLHVPDVLPGPERLKYQICEAQHLHNSQTASGSDACKPSL